jgi:hypothetical protein
MYLIYAIDSHTFGFITRAAGCTAARFWREPDVFSSCGKALLLGSALWVVPLASASAHIPADEGPDPGCTVLDGTRGIALEVIAPHSADFCALLAQAVAVDVLHTHVGVTPALWHYAGATRNCRLHLATRAKPQITVYNSRKACHWLRLSGWHAVEPSPGKPIRA